MPLINPPAASGFTPAYYSGFYDLASGNTVWNVTSTTFSDFNVATSTSLAARSNSNITASGGGVNVLPSITLTLPATGVYIVSVSFPMFGSAADAHGIRLTDGTNVLGITSDTSNSATLYSPTITGILVATSTTVTLKLQGRANSGSVKIGYIGGNGGNAFEWNIWRIA